MLWRLQCLWSFFKPCRALYLLVDGNHLFFERSQVRYSKFQLWTRCYRSKIRDWLFWFCCSLLYFYYFCLWNLKVKHVSWYVHVSELFSFSQRETLFPEVFPEPWVAHERFGVLRIPIACYFQKLGEIIVQLFFNRF